LSVCIKRWPKHGVDGDRWIEVNGLIGVDVCTLLTVSTLTNEDTKQP
jgi:hypothetical protein